MNREKIAEIVNKIVADVFNLDPAYVAEHPELNYRADFAATSLHYFPLLADLEDQLNVEVENHYFQNRASTVADTIDFMDELVNGQK